MFVVIFPFEGWWTSMFNENNCVSIPIVASEMISPVILLDSKSNGLFIAVTWLQLAETIVGVVESGQFIGLIKVAYGTDSLANYLSCIMTSTIFMTKIGEFNSLGLSFLPIF